MRRALRAAVSVTAASTVCALIANPLALAAGSPGWRTVQEFGASYGSPQLYGGVAVSAQSAWVEGNTYLTSDSLFLGHWNGSRWSQKAGPAVLSGTSASVSPGPMAMSAASLWVFPTLSAATNRVYAARLTSGHWTTWRLPGALRIDGAATFGDSEVWAFGEAVLPPGWRGLQNGPTYAERFNGRRWRRVSLPGVPLSVQALSRNDIWAYGPTNRTASAADQRFVAMHWNGHRWRTLPIPRIRATNGKLMWPSGLAVLKHDSLWITEEFHCANPGSCNPAQPPGMILAHWDGRKWIRVLDRPSYQLAAPEPDGHRGLWIEAMTVKNPRWAYLHYAHGRLRVSFPPSSASGTPANVSPPIPIPGTNSAWATGQLPLGGATSVAAVFKYRP